jgi:hypothetical protein
VKSATRHSSTHGVCSLSVTVPTGFHRSSRAQARGRKCSRASTSPCRGAHRSTRRGGPAAPCKPRCPARLFLRRRPNREAPTCRIGRGASTCGARSKTRIYPPGTGTALFWS